MKIGKRGKHLWEQKDLDFLRNNFKTMTNKQLADGLGIRLTTCRTKLYELGLKRMEMEYWTPEQVQFLRDNYRTMGDVEMAELFNEVCPKKKPWCKRHINKKRKYLNLFRSKDEIAGIIKRNFKHGRFDNAFSKMWKSNTITEVGDIRIWKDQNGKNFAVIKTEVGFKHYNRWLFFQSFFTLPSNVLVVTRSGEMMAKGPEDLMIIDMKENGRRASLHQYPKELWQTVQLIRNLQNQIKNKNERQ